MTGVLIPLTFYIRCYLGKMNFSTFEMKLQFCCTEDLRMTQSRSLSSLRPLSYHSYASVRVFEVRLVLKLLMEVAAARCGTGGKRFPDISHLVGRRGPAAGLSLFSVQVEQEREEGGCCGCLISSLVAIIDLNVYL